MPQTDLWDLATYEIKPRLNRLSGVASVLVQGGQRPEFHVTVDPAQMLRTSVAIGDVVGAINRTNIIDSPGLLNRNHQLFLGLVTAQVHTPEEIGDIVIKSVKDTPVRIRDIGSVAPAVEPIYTAVSANGKPAVLLSVNRQPESNTVQVADEVHQEMANIRPTLPAGVEMRPFYDQSGIVTESIASVRDAIIIGLFLAGLIIWLFLRDWGTAVMTGLVVPVTMVVTFIVMKILGQTFNLMTLGGLAAAVGLVIDDKIVVVENIVRTATAGRAAEATASALGTDRSADRIDAHPDRGLPAAHHDHRCHRRVLQRAGDRDERVAAGALVLALVWTSNLSTRLIRRGQKGASAAALAVPPVPSTGSNRNTTRSGAAAHDGVEEASLGTWLFGHVLVAYERVLRRSLKHRGSRGFLPAALRRAAAATGCSAAILPAFDEGGFVLDYVMPAGSSLQETNRVLTHVEAILRGRPRSKAHRGAPASSFAGCRPNRTPATLPSS